jgi:hypothetical protein
MIVPQGQQNISRRRDLRMPNGQSAARPERAASHRQFTYSSLATDIGTDFVI